MHALGGGGGTISDQGGPNIAGTNGPGGPLIAGDHKFHDSPVATVFLGGGGGGSGGMLSQNFFLILDPLRMILRHSQTSFQAQFTTFLVQFPGNGRNLYLSAAILHAKRTIMVMVVRDDGSIIR